MTTGLETFANPADIGALYPFVGSETLMTIILLVLWVAWHVWQIKSENREYDEAVRKYREKGTK